MSAARRLRAVSWTLEVALFLVIAGSVAAIGSVHPWAYVPLWFACLAIGLLLAVKVSAVASLRRVIGRQRFAFHFSDRWITLDADPGYGVSGWSFDLREPALPRPALLLPGAVFAGWVVFQLLPLPPDFKPSTLSLPDTLRGLAFLASGLVLHVAAASVFTMREARERFRRALATLGAILAFVALTQLAAGTNRIYGVFQPLEKSGAVFGPFVNRNHFAGYMLMVVPMCLALFVHTYRRYARRVGERPNLRRRLVSLGAPEGVALLYASVPVLAAAGALIATTSRGALLAFVVSLGLAVLGLRSRAEVPGWVLGLAFVTMALGWFGLERLELRFTRALDDAPGRTLVWKDSVRRMDGLWLTGSGFNTFAVAMSRVTPWALPKGASPWPEPLAEALTTGSRVGVRVLEAIPGQSWYREAHNDYVQLLVETGVPGLLVSVWGAFAALNTARQDPWLLAALAGVLMHSFVEFDLQIPAIPVLFVVLAGMRLRPERA